MPVAPPSGEYCSFTDLNNGIWQFQFLTASNEAVDEWVAWQNYLKNLPPEPEVTMVRTLLDFRPAGLVSMLYALRKNQEWRSQNPDIGPIPVKVAIVLRPLNNFYKGYAELLKEGINVFGMRRVQVEMFPGGYQRAIDWLLDG